VAYGESEEHIFLGKEFAHRRDFSEATAELIDREVSRIIKECYDRAEQILLEHMDQLHLVAKTLLERETLDGDELRRLLTGEELSPLKTGSSNGSGPQAEGTADDESAAATSAADPGDPAAEKATDTSGASDIPQAAASSQTEKTKPRKPSKPDAEDLFGAQH
ncbi:MAG: hypothetical protein ACE5G2_06655, partial [Candidatus Krumholzibacteriia bacterium]